MIEIKITSQEITREQLNCDLDKVDNRSTAEIMVEGNSEEIKSELISLLEAFEKNPTLGLIWHEALREYIFEIEGRDK